MENDRFIDLQQFCDHYRVEVSFVKTLHEFGLVQITQVEEIECLDKDCLGEIERMMHLHYDLEINLEGVEAIHHLLSRVREMQKELTLLRNRLNMNG